MTHRFHLYFSLPVARDRADEKCVKGHLRLGLANVGLGKYKEAKANFKQVL